MLTSSTQLGLKLTSRPSALLVLICWTIPLVTVLLCRPARCLRWWAVFLASYGGLLTHSACAQAAAASRTAAVSAALPARLQPYYVGTLGATHPIHLTFFLTKDLLEASYYYHPAAGDIPLVGARDRAGTLTLQ